MPFKPNILVVCGRNKRRSRTAEHMFRNDGRFNIRSAGLSPSSDRKLSEADLNWADLTFVMEADQRAKIRSGYQHMDLPDIDVLDISDDYEFMDEELADMLRGRMDARLEQVFGI